MLDKSIPYKNIIMRADRFISNISPNLPNGYCFKYFDNGDDIFWAGIETSVGEFETTDEALKYLHDHYFSDVNELKKRCLFVLDEKGNYAGTCTAWHDKRQEDMISTIHWFGVKPEFQGQGLGKALLGKTLELFDSLHLYPVYIHTQTWSYKAVLLYHRAGFEILKNESFSDIENEFLDAMPVLKTVLDKSSYNVLLNSAR